MRKSPKWSSTSNLGNKALGAYGERRAAAWYAQQGFEILATNWLCKGGELDLVAARGGLLVFAEVKARSSGAFGTAIEAMTPVKQTRVRHAAYAFLAAHEGFYATIRFDVVCVTNGKLEVVTGAF